VDEVTAPLPIEHRAKSVGSARWPFPLLLLSVYFLAKPFYFFPSGGPQIGDVVVPALLVWLFALGTDAPGARSLRVLFWCVLFILYALIVNGTWGLLLANSSMFKMPIFMLFNLGIFVICLLLADRYGDRFFEFVVHAVAAALIAQALLSFVVDNSLKREVIFFNNPNQLGYWSLLSASIFFVCATRIRVHPYLSAAVAITSLYLVALSLSKAAILASLGLFALVYGVRLKKLLLVVPVALAAVFALQGSELYENVAWRIGNIGAQSDDSLGVRGYQMLWEHPQYLLLGAGQGAFERFRGLGSTGTEFHSTLGSLLFSYGVVGFGLFSLFMWQIYREAGMYRFAFLAPAFVYGFTHQGLRFSVFWALFALVASVRPETRNELDAR